MRNQLEFGSVVEAVFYSTLMLIVIWLIYWADHLFPEVAFYKFGVKPGDMASWKGIFLMPMIHSKKEIGHILNNSPSIFILLMALIYYYRKIALKVFVLAWLLSGLGIWLFAKNTNTYHIGISGVIYALAAFLFTSGVIRQYRPLQGVALFVAFLYGSMIWGIFPIEPKISWEGHLSGMISGIILAFLFEKAGPQRPKYQYEIEKEMGIEPPDLEGQWRAQIEEAEARMKREKELQKQQNVKVVYHYKKGKEEN